jgi:hypothetical protein
MPSPLNKNQKYQTPSPARHNKVMKQIKQKNAQKNKKKCKSINTKKKCNTAHRAGIFALSFALNNPPRYQVPERACGRGTPRCQTV